MRNNEDQKKSSGLGRRHFVAMLGASAVGASFFDKAFGRSATSLAYAPSRSPGSFGGQTEQRIVSRAGITVLKEEGFKPVYLPAAGSSDPGVLSLAENLFWNDIMMEHALFIQLHLPGAELESQRLEAQKFQAIFQRQFELTASASFDGGTFVQFNRSTIDLLAPYIAFKRKLQAAQAAGEIRSLAFPSFLGHIADEAERFMLRLDRLSKGIVALDQNEEVDFWRETMGEHAAIISQYLDPTEKQLIAQARAFQERFASLEASDLEGVIAATRDIITFKTAATRGVMSAEIASKIPPALADHVRREAIKAENDLSRL